MSEESSRHRNVVLNSVAAAIGGTPLVELRRAAADLDGRLLAKLEYLNPGFSKKDRIALQIVEEAERSGELRRGMPVVELTSGNTGTGLAIVCAARRHRFIAVMSRGNSMERAGMMRALGAEVVLVDQAPGSRPGEVSGADLDLVEQRAQALTHELGAFRADQFTRSGNFNAHYLGTGPEILQQTDGRIDAFVDFVGSGGTFAGCARAFKQFNRAIRCFVVEPAGAEVLAGQPVTQANHPIQGGGYARRLPLLDTGDVDGYLAITGEEAREGARRLAREEGLFGGFSTGANYMAARHVLRDRMPGATVVFLACDSGLKYLSTDLWE